VLIGMQPGLELVAITPTSDMALGIFAEKRPDLTLMDLDLPADDGVDAICRIRQIDPEARVIALVTDDSGESGIRAVAAGAEAVVAKDLIGEILVPMILRRQPEPGPVAI